MAIRLLIISLLLVTSQAWAASLVWEYDTSTGGTIPANALVERGPASSGPFTLLATIPSLPATYPLPASPDTLWYRIANEGGVSNVVQYVATGSYDDTAIQQALADLSTRVATLEARVTTIDAKNAAQDTTDIALAARVAVLEATVKPVPEPTSAITVKDLSDTQVEVACVNGTRPSQVLDATGTKRILSCTR